MRDDDNKKSYVFDNRFLGIGKGEIRDLKNDYKEALEEELECAYSKFALENKEALKKLATEELLSSYDEFSALEALAEAPKAKRYNKDKLNFSDMPLEALIEVAKVTTMGAKKYGRLNWQKGQPLSDLADATLRHLIGDNKHKGAFTGEANDPESGLLHLAHAAWNVLAIIHQLRDNEKYKQFLDLPGYDKG